MDDHESSERNLKTRKIRKKRYTKRLPRSRRNYLDSRLPHSSVSVPVTVPVSVPVLTGTCFSRFCVCIHRKLKSCETSTFRHLRYCSGCFSCIDKFLRRSDTGNDRNPYERKPVKYRQTNNRNKLHNPSYLRLPPVEDERVSESEPASSVKYDKSERKPEWQWKNPPGSVTTSTKSSRFSTSSYKEKTGSELDKTSVCSRSNRHDSRYPFKVQLIQ